MFNNDYYYHIYNRGVEKRQVFLDKDDYQRFLLSLKEFNRLEPVGSLYDLKKKAVEPLYSGPTAGAAAALAQVVCYCLNPNHYHLLLKQKRAGGISELVKRLSGGYTCYFNNRYSRSGALFQGKYKHKEIKTEGSLMKLSVYINCNAEIHGIDKKENWPWSSYKEYAGKRSDASKGVRPLGMGIPTGLEYKKLCEELLPEIKQIKNLDKYGLE
ncbi:MAG: transposase [Patescibacteria group bacterium]|nr:transposase [Patescibacteria group bacterium]